MAIFSNVSAASMCSYAILNKRVLFVASCRHWLRVTYCCPQTTCVHSASTESIRIYLIACFILRFMSFRFLKIRAKNTLELFQNGVTVLKVALLRAKDFSVQ